MLNTGIRSGELLGLLNSDIDLKKKVMHLQRGVKEIAKRDGVDAEPGREVKVGKLKSTASKRTVPLNSSAIKASKTYEPRATSAKTAPLWPTRAESSHDL